MLKVFAKFRKNFPEGHGHKRGHNRAYVQTM